MSKPPSRLNRTDARWDACQLVTVSQLIIASLTDRTEAVISALDEHGFCIVENFVNKDVVAALKRDMLASISHNSYRNGSRFT